MSNINLRNGLLNNVLNISDRRRPAFGGSVCQEARRHVNQPHEAEGITHRGSLSSYGPAARPTQMPYFLSLCIRLSVRINRLVHHAHFPVSALFEQALYFPPF